MELSEQQKSINVYDEEQIRLKQIMDNVLTKKIQKILQEKEKVKQLYIKQLEEKEKIRLEVSQQYEKEHKLLQYYKEELNSYISNIDSSVNYSKIDTSIYIPLNGYTKDYGKIKVDINSESYIISSISYPQQPNSNCNDKSEINNYGEIITYSSGNYIDPIKLKSYRLKKFKDNEYLLPDIIIDKIKKFWVQSYHDFSKLCEFIFMCRLNAQNYYKQLYYKHLYEEEINKKNQLSKLNDILVL